METPLFTHLAEYHAKNRISFAMPGHKNGRGLNPDLLRCDVTELKETENLYNPREFITKSQKLLSQLFNSDESFILTGGSTAGIQAMIAACLKPNDTLLASADCHKSVVNTCALLGINIKLIPVETEPDFLIPTGINNIEAYLDGADAVMITSPNYYGIVKNIAKIAKICHERNIPLLVDEAHGAHFVSGAHFPKPAIMQGADAAVESAHKTIIALNGAAFLHIKSKIILRGKIKKMLTMFQSTSPSYVIAASADIARAEIASGGWDEIAELCKDFKTKLENTTNIKTLKNDDITRLVLNFAAYDTTGFEIEEKLCRRGIDIEMADLLNIVLIVTNSNTENDLDALYSALTDIVSQLNISKKTAVKLPPNICTDILSPQKAVFAKTAFLPIDKCIGKISAATITAYPPGIPIIYTGEKITLEKLEYIKYLRDLGAEITGLCGNLIETAEE